MSVFRKHDDIYYSFDDDVEGSNIFFNCSEDNFVIDVNSNNLENYEAYFEYIVYL